MSTFRDIDLKFTRHPITGDVAQKSDNSAIAQSIRELVLTSVGDWGYGADREIGGNVYDLLGENYHPLTGQNIRGAVFEVVTSFEPRVELRDVTVQPMMDQPNAVVVTITYMILNRPDIETVNIPLVRLR